MTQPTTVLYRPTPQVAYNRLTQAPCPQWRRSGLPPDAGSPPGNAAAYVVRDRPSTFTTSSPVASSAAILSWTVVDRTVRQAGQAAEPNAPHTVGQDDRGRPTRVEVPMATAPRHWLTLSVFQVAQQAL
jgi:hypothetical protein